MTADQFACLPSCPPACQLSAGQTVCDIWGQSQQPKNVDVATSMGVPAFWDLMISALHRADDASCMNKPV